MYFIALWYSISDDLADLAITSVLSELESISLSKEEQRTTLRAFLNRKNIFAFLSTEFALPSGSAGHRVCCFDWVKAVRNRW